jgi:hypothetical protein
MTHRVYEPLEYVVLCQQSVGPEEAIAAFNSDRVARSYARDCTKGKPGSWRYRVVQVTAPVESQLVELATITP